MQNNVIFFVKKFAQFMKKQYFCTVKLNAQKYYKILTYTNNCIKKSNFLTLKTKKTMSTRRKINGTIALVVAIIITSMVCFYWYRMDCGVGSLVAALCFYPSCIAAVWAVIDEAIKTKEEQL